MADIKSVDIPINEWTEITDADCYYQNRSNGDILITQNSDTPDNTDEAFVVQPKKTGNYTSDDDKLWAYRTFEGSCKVIYQAT